MNEPNIALDEQSFLLSSDVHGNVTALEEMLKRAPNTRYNVFLGDAVNRGEYPSETLQHINSHFHVGIKGNHDDMVLRKLDGDYHPSDLESADETRLKLNPEDLAVLECLVPFYSRGKMLFFHGTPESNEEYLFDTESVRELFKRNPFHDIFFGGHCHIPRIASVSRKDGALNYQHISNPFSQHHLNLETNRYLINVPSLSEPRMGSSMGYGVMTHQSAKEKTLSLFFMQHS